MEERPQNDASVGVQQRARFDESARPLVLDGILAQVMSSLVGGAFLAAYALALGATQFQIGLLAALPAAGQLMQVPAVLLIRRLGRRKPIALTAGVVSRSTWLLIAAVPLVFGPPAAFMAVAVLVLVAAAVGSMGGVAWLSWMRDLIPQEVMGRFFSRRMMLANGVAIVASLGAAYFVEQWGRQSPRPELGYSMVFAAGVLLGYGGVVALSRVFEPPAAPASGSGGVLDDLARPFGDANFRQLILFSGAWTFAITFAAPFYVVYMLERIGLPLSLVIGLTIVSQVFLVLCVRLWGGLADRYSNRSVLGAAGSVLLIAILGWTFTTLPERYFLTIPLLVFIHMAMGAAMGGISLATGNIGLKLSPMGRAEAYVTSLGLVNSIVAFVGPLLAGVLAGYFGDKGVALTLTWMSGERLVDVPTINLRGLDFLFLITFLLGLYAMHRLAFVEEEGSVDEAVVLEEFREQMMEDVRAIASFATLRQVVTFPGSALARTLRRGRDAEAAGAESGDR